MSQALANQQEAGLTAARQTVEPVPEPAAGIAPQTLRQALGQFPTGVTVITTLDRAEQPTGMTASSFNSLSLSPPLVLWSIDKHTGCFDAFSQCQHFAIHTLTSSQQALSNRFAKRGLNKFEGLNYDIGLGAVPLLGEYCARFQCRVEHRYDGGDHIIIVGRVQQLDQQPEQAPLVFHRGRYAALAELTP